MPQPRRSFVFVVGGLIVAIAIVGGALGLRWTQAQTPAESLAQSAPQSPPKADSTKNATDAKKDDSKKDTPASEAAIPTKFDGAAAYTMLQRVCNIGTRISGTAGMLKQQKLLKTHFEELGGKVSFQQFAARDPRNGQRVNMANLLVQWHPERKQRILICAHYDTRPFPDRDPVAANRTKPFIGANDGASGVAFLAELGRHMKTLEGAVGVDFVLFDGEEYVFSDRDEYFLGSTYFAKQYAAGDKATVPRDYKYNYGILVDMIGDKDLQLFQERNSLSFPATRPLVQSIWATAAKMGVREFIARPNTEVLDDHLPLNQIAKIPTCDIIDFNYPNPRARFSYWHTTQDTPNKCSGKSLEKVGKVVLQWLRLIQKQPAKKGSK